MTRLWLRWYDTTGNWIPTPVEQEQAKTQRLAARLQELGLTSEELENL